MSDGVLEAMMPNGTDCQKACKYDLYLLRITILENGARERAMGLSRALPACLCQHAEKLALGVYGELPIKAQLVVFHRAFCDL